MQYRHLDAHTPYLQLCMSHTPPSNLYHPYHQLKSGSFPKTHPPHKESEVVQSSPTLCNPRDCSLPGFSVCGIFQARVLEWVAISFSRGSSWPRDWTQVSHIAGRLFTIWATREAPTYAQYVFVIIDDEYWRWIKKGEWYVGRKLVWELGGFFVSI